MTTDRSVAAAAPIDQQAVLNFLLQAEPGMQRVDTHASIVFLGRDRVLKVKRAVRLPFLDYATLEKRKQACEEELRVNTPFAPQIYRRVVAITREPDGLAIGGGGEPVEWAVEMARFDETRSFDHLAARQDISTELATALADAILAAHAQAPQIRSAGWINSVEGLIERNTARFRTVDGLAASDIDRLDARSHGQRVAHARLLQDRANTGFVRHCHGDLHLGNIVLIDDHPVLFDAIEFDPVIATTDMLYDLAFPMMDLIHYGCTTAANALFNRYIENGADANLDALALLPLFLSLRAAIRAHVLFTKAEQSGKSGGADRDEAKRYFDLAIALIDPRPPCLVAVGGLSGTGKSVLARGIAPTLGPPPGALVLRTDVIRKKLFGVAATERLPPSAYTPDVTAQVYDALLNGAERAAAQGISVILDATFLRGDEREAFAKLAPVGIPHIGVFLTAERVVRLARIAQRTNDASDATAAVAIQQEAMSLGAVDWQQIDAGGTREQTRDRAGRYLGSCAVPTGDKP
ncbi:bifunctional aminoglycoside phosphotransferase/ATP-binding protein [soil metagenome]